jgi:hypothetical protein
MTPVAVSVNGADLARFGSQTTLLQTTLAPLSPRYPPHTGQLGGRHKLMSPDTHAAIVTDMRDALEEVRKELRGGAVNAVLHIQIEAALARAKQLDLDRAYILGRDSRWPMLCIPLRPTPEADIPDIPGSQWASRR